MSDFLIIKQSNNKYHKSTVYFDQRLTDTVVTRKYKKRTFFHFDAVI